MEPKFSVFASFCLYMIMFSIMFRPVNGEKFSLMGISDSVKDLIKYFQVILFFHFKKFLSIFKKKFLLNDGSLLSR